MTSTEEVGGFHGKSTATHSPEYLGKRPTSSQATRLTAAVLRSPTVEIATTRPFPTASSEQRQNRIDALTRSDRPGTIQTLTEAGMTSDRTNARQIRQSLVIDFSGPVTVKKSGLVIPQSLSLAAWERIGRELASFCDSSAWWLADWLIYGETAYSGRYREVLERTGLSYQTLRNYAWVARRFDQSRRRESVSFAHHAEVASLEVAEQDYWLRRADEQRWSRNRLRKEVQASLGERRTSTDPDSSADDERARRARGIQVLLPPEELERCERVATAHGLSVDAWVTQVLQSAISSFENSSLTRLAV